MFPTPTQVVMPGGHRTLVLTEMSSTGLYTTSMEIQEDGSALTDL